VSCGNQTTGTAAEACQREELLPDEAEGRKTLLGGTGRRFGAFGKEMHATGLENGKFGLKNA
jgi:hypothetical protein